MIRACAVSALLLTAAAPAFALQDGEYSTAVAATAQSDIIPAYQALEQAAERLCGGRSRCWWWRWRHWLWLT